MKALKKITILLLLAALAACKKDKETDDQSYYQYSGQKYQITGAKLLAYQDDLTLDLKTERTSAYIRIQFNRVNGVLPEGTLILHESAATYKPEQHFASAIFGAKGLDNMVTAGMITIEKLRNGYQIDLDLLAPDGKLTGVYKGPVARP